MAGIHDLGWFIVSGLLLNFTPGADTLYIVGRSATQGFRAGAVAALGIGAGCCLHILAAAAGLSALLLASATAFGLVKLAGAAYLVYLGIALLRSGRRVEVPVGHAGAPLATVFTQGVITNALNPKVALFFLAFLPQFVAAEAEHKFVALILLGVIFNVNGTLWNFIVAWIAARARRGGRGRVMATWMGRVTGGLLILMGVRLALATRS